MGVGDKKTDKVRVAREFCYGLCCYGSYTTKEIKNAKLLFAFCRWFWFYLCLV